MHSIDRAICSIATPVEDIGAALRAIFTGVDCPDCLRRAIEETEERSRVLHELLVLVESVS